VERAAAKNQDVYFYMYKMDNSIKKNKKTGRLCPQDTRVPLLLDKVNKGIKL
jgi:hypothetical protein